MTVLGKSSAVSKSTTMLNADHVGDDGGRGKDRDRADRVSGHDAGRLRLRTLLRAPSGKLLRRGEGGQGPGLLQRLAIELSRLE